MSTTIKLTYEGARKMIQNPKRNTFRPLPTYTTKIPVSVGVVWIVGSLFSWVYIVTAFVA